MATRERDEHVHDLDLGPNRGLVEEMYRRFVENPASVSESWRDFFADYRPPASRPSTAAARPSPLGRGTPEPAAPRPGLPVAAPPPAEPVAPAEPLVLEGDEVTPLRGAAARIAQNMEASLEVPTATSVRTIPAHLLEGNRRIVNNHLARTRGGKVSFTHLIAYAVVKALGKVPGMSSGYGVLDGRPSVVRHRHVNLGLAVDVERPDGSRSLLVPNVKRADTLTFSEFFQAYEDLIRKVRSGKVEPDDLAGTTGTITNPGMIGTGQSVPRLVRGQGFIIGVGSIGYPAEYEGADPRTLARLGVGKVLTITSTYDHRVIQGAESGELLGWVHDLLLGAEGFYDEVFTSLRIPYSPYRWSTDENPPEGSAAAVEKQARVAQLVNMYRVRGHLIADLDPLGRSAPRMHPELDPAHHGLTIWDLDREFATDGLAGRSVMRLREALTVLRDAYARSVGVEYMHIQEPDQKAWIQRHVEGEQPELSHGEQSRILERLNAAEAFERFLHTKYLGHKRFSLEGAESLVPMLDAVLDDAADHGLSEAVVGMAHRGRLNVLANVIGKPLGQIFREFEGRLDPTSVEGSGDLRYHLGATGTHTAPSGATLALTLASNPSHLEAVDPVVEGMARAKEDRRGDPEHGSVLPLLVHGDAAFAGQGVVAETLNLSAVAGYEVGGTLHVVVNNQLGFTTAPEHGRSSVYATDVAKIVQAPIFHVNGDDPEACVRVMRLAFAFRQAFHKDVVVDLVCYRRYGHNEADEPAFTQPRMYALVEGHRSVRKRYTEQLVDRGDLTLDEAEAALEDFRHRLQAAFDETRRSEPPSAPPPAPPVTPEEPVVDTSVGREALDRVVSALVTRPEGFSVHPKLERLLLGHRAAFDEGRVDWPLAEALAFGTLVTEGTPVRVAGQDTRRGTFSQRHGVLVDARTEAEHVPLAHVAEGQAPFMLYDSVLSEYAALGFEYGYSVADPEALVCWEAQFGDFVNGAQIIVDQFVAAAEDKWGQRSNLVLLLPHGFEGQGPEHSSARLDRFLALVAGGNLRVAYPSTAGQYFHLLRRQARSPRRRPLVCLTPKRYLRTPHTRVPVAELTGGTFRAVLDDRRELDRPGVRRVLVCAGKVAHELMDRRDELDATVAVVRVEQLAPWPETELAEVLASYPGEREVRWVQEEPANMGAWDFVRPRLGRLLGEPAGREVPCVSRPASPSPATGSHTVHEREQEALLAAAFEGAGGGAPG
ncbi:MAG: multifunctional oxoglutarate decarboxylase/oxoglutarate dehydrogenase thiamine pyrophosphate-binding subunit/dihydrolipoyllysine-residue succinyltransferase subunit [Acidimicrobiia bacterium]|nr:multifunctional oxoglutarate decarboxylase/oxoglutarate dehydrogenase thiamine pyrophosphate-binding subunit/dihydrolipoyllysine-residue succinyltransferase subunit [Acidimicrobiia bacterium]